MFACHVSSWGARIPIATETTTASSCPGSNCLCFYFLAASSCIYLLSIPVEGQDPVLPAHSDLPRGGSEPNIGNVVAVAILAYEKGSVFDRQETEMACQTLRWLPSIRGSARDLVLWRLRLPT